MSIRTIAASHPYEFRITGPGIVEWTFPNILLPDSTTNLLESQGFVQFNIGFRSPLVLDQAIENTAAIYFDFNPPIITNTVRSVVKEPIIVSIKAKGDGLRRLQVFPNPAADWLNIDLSAIPGKGTLRLYDVTGYLWRQVVVQGGKPEPIDVSGLPAGLYYLEFAQGDLIVGRARVIVL